MNDAEPTQVVNIQIDVSGIPSRIQVALQAIINCVSIGLNARNDITQESLVVADQRMRLTFNSSAPWTVETAGMAWEMWVLRNGFRDVAEAFGGILEEVQVVLACCDLFEHQRTHGTLNPEEYEKITYGRQSTFHRKTVVQRLDFLKKKYGFVIEESLVKQMLSINAARNCYVHRGGLVSEQDELVDGFLNVEWRSMAVWVVEGGKEIELEPPHLFPGGTEVFYGIKGRKKSFAVNEWVSFDLKEFTQVCWTLFTFSAVCSEVLRAHMAAKGIPSAQQPDAVANPVANI